MLTGTCARILTVLAISLLTLLSPSISSAEHSGDRLIVDAGLKMWVASWQAPLLFAPSGDLMHQKASALMLGPSLTAALKTSESPWFNHLFFNFTYLTTGSQFDFDYNKTCPNSTCSNLGVATGFPTNPYKNIKAERSDLNLIVGTNVYRGLGAFMGYFHSAQTTHFERFVNSQTSPATFLEDEGLPTNERTIDAFIFGLSASGDLSENLDFRGNLAGALGGLKYGNLTGASDTSVPLTGWSSEVGMKWHGHVMPKLEPYLYFGFRVQAYQVDYEVSRRTTINNITATRTQTLAYEDLTYGPVFQIGAQF